MALKVELKPNERILIGESVITNCDQRIVAADRRLEPDPAREGHPDGRARRHAGQAHLSRGPIDVHVARPARAPRDLFRAGARNRAGGAQHLGVRRDYQ